MKKNMIKVLGAVALFGSLFLTTETNAQSWNNNYYNGQSHINNQQNNQYTRIEEGIRSGSLTPQEAARLRQKVEMIKRQEAFAKRDGRFTYQEQASINRQLDQLAKEIYNQKHDFQNNHNSNPYWRR
jgi:hypothetical protein